MKQISLRQIYLEALVITILAFSSCARPPVETTPPTESLPSAPATTAPVTPSPIATAPPSIDTMPPSSITGLRAVDAYDGRVNLWWEKNTAEDFEHYNIYLAESAMEDVGGMTPVHQIRNANTGNYQITELKDGTRYYFTVTAVDRSGNESRLASSVSATPTPMPRGTPEPDISVDVYQADMVWPGTTLLPDNHIRGKPRIIEVNMLGEIIWEYIIPEDLRRYTNPGFDVELLANNHILFLLPGHGIHEINRSGDVIWSYLDSKVSHDADRLPNGNTLVAFGNEDGASDAQVKEIDPGGEIVWSWSAKDHFDKPPYKEIYDQGWTHTNAVTRLANGNTLISPRNFNFLVEVDPRGAVVRTIGEGVFHYQHDPQNLPNGNILLANHRRPHRAVELDPETGGIIWQSTGFERDNSPVRDANRLANGNTLITGTKKIVEITSGGETVWQLTLKGATFQGIEAAALGFYKAERISPTAP